MGRCQHKESENISNYAAWWPEFPLLMMLLPSSLVSPLPSRARRFSQRVALTWEPSRLQRGPYTGRGAKPAGLVSDRTRSFESLELFHFSLEILPNSLPLSQSSIPLH